MLGSAQSQLPLEDVLLNVLRQDVVELLDLLHDYESESLLTLILGARGGIPFELVCHPDNVYAFLLEVGFVILNDQRAVLALDPLRPELACKLRNPDVLVPASIVLLDLEVHVLVGGIVLTQELERHRDRLVTPVVEVEVLRFPSVDKDVLILIA